MSQALRRFLKLEAAGGLILMGCAVLAFIASNSALSPLYDAFLNVPGQVRVGELDIQKPLLLWVNDLWMAVFFFLVGLEIKRELLEGSLSTRETLMLPCVAALGGMVAPALIYAGINWGDSVALRGWAIPAATDIAFALGVLALLGSRVPIALKVFLTAVAIVDDLGAIIIIALFYTADLNLTSLGLAAAGVLALIIANRSGVRAVPVYLAIGLFMWVCVLKSGVHATLAGVATALAIPLAGAKPEDESPLKSLEHSLHPLVAFLILPTFAFANAGVSLAGVQWSAMLQPVTLGIACGLVFGKVIGVFGASWIAIKLGMTRLPDGANFKALFGVSLLCGIGFTMSLFIGTLAWEEDAGSMAVAVRLGVLGGSIIAAVLGYLWLRMVLPAKSADPAEDAAPVNGR
ncbi:MAG: Na+/H+ antiporter NhaA [Betaproteobacteria bacterium]|nr:Na+/H+ antiporter NhaA [Betaproteobacteria bacterium]